MKKEVDVLARLRVEKKVCSRRERKGKELETAVHELFITGSRCGIVQIFKCIGEAF